MPEKLNNTNLEKARSAANKYAESGKDIELSNYTVDSSENRKISTPLHCQRKIRNKCFPRRYAG